jgi:serine/threonine protein kinase/Leucine-rich repeat (LRR) protein
MSEIASCPDHETLEQLLLGKVADPLGEQLAQHLEQCGRCATIVARVQNRDTLTEASQLSLPLADAPDQAVVQRLVELLQSLAPSADAAPAEADPSRYEFLAPTERPDELGRLGGYRVLKVLGSGGMGIVFQAEDVHLRRSVALKVLKPLAADNSGAKMRFLREARSAASLEHENVISIYQVGEERGVPFLAMPLLKGTTLEQRLGQPGLLTVPEVVQVGRQISSALAAAHERNVIHRDIKPANIFLELVSPGTTRVKILDFGLARAAADDVALTQSGVQVGTPGYMSPEQARGEKVDYRSDLFSLGVVLYRMCTGKLPFLGANSMALLTALAVDQPRPVRERNPAVPPALAELIMQLLAKDPAARPASAAAVARRLADLEAGQPAPAESPTVPVPAPPGAPAPLAPDLGRANKQPPAGPTWPSRPPNRHRTVAVTLLLLVMSGLVAGATIIYIKTDTGTLEIVTDDPKVKVVVERNGEVIEILDSESRQKVSIRSGKIKLKLEGDKTDGLELTTDQGTNPITLKRGGRVVVKVTPMKRVRPGKKEIIAKPGVEAPSLEAERRAANWVLANGGSIRLRMADKERGVGSAKDLPTGSFKVVEIRLADKATVTDEGLKSLYGLTALKEVDLTGTKVTAAGVAALQRALPKCHIFSGLRDTPIPELPADSGSPDADRGAAQWALAMGGVVRIRVAGKERQPTEAKDLPTEAFQTFDIRVHEKNRADDPGLAKLKGLRHLTELSLVNRPVADAEMAHLSDLTALQRLNLHRTGVGDAGVAHLKDLKSLVVLVLNRTEVGDAGVAHLKNLQKLTQLRLSATRVSDGGLAHLQNLPSLQKLELQGTRVTGAGLVHVKALKNLIALDLCGTRVGDGGLDHLKDLPNLTALSLAGTPVGDAGLAHLKGMTGLVHLDLARTQITDAGLAHLRGLKNLNSLFLSGTRVTDAGLTHLKGLTNLDRLHLRATRVTDTGLEHLLSLSRLALVDLQRTRVSAKGFADLRATFPGKSLDWSEPNRDAAGAVLALKGMIHIRPNGSKNDRAVKAAADLPATYFRVTRVNLTGIRNPLREVLPRLAALSDPLFDQFAVLDLSGSSVSDNDLQHLKPLVINLIRTDASPHADPPWHSYRFGPLTNLTELSLARTEVAGDGLKHLKALTGLRRLVLDDLPLRGPELAHLKDLPALTELRLGCSRLTDLGVKDLANLKRLKQLSLAGSNVSDEGLKSLHGLTALKELDLTSTKVTAAGVAALQKAVPDCHIFSGLKSK